MFKNGGGRGQHGRRSSYGPSEPSGPRAYDRICIAAVAGTLCRSATCNPTTWNPAQRLAPRDILHRKSNPPEGLQSPAYPSKPPLHLASRSLPHRRWASGSGKNELTALPQGRRPDRDSPPVCLACTIPLTQVGSWRGETWGILVKEYEGVWLGGRSLSPVPGAGSYL